MSRQRPSAVGPRVPKEDFMKALGLTASDSRHEGYYRSMRDEAIAVYNRLNTDRSNLIEEKRRDKDTKPPFFWHHIDPGRRREAIIETWQRAAPGSVQRRLFDLGATNGEHAPNWVTLWLLYSVFRSRDIRNNRSRRAGESQSSSSSSAQTSGDCDPIMFDTVRNQYRTLPTRKLEN